MHDRGLVKVDFDQMRLIPNDRSLDQLVSKEESLCRVVRAGWPLGTTYKYQKIPPSAPPELSSIKTASSLPSGEVTRISSTPEPREPGFEMVIFATTKPNIAKQNPSAKPTTAAANRLNFGLYIRRLHHQSQKVEVQGTSNHLVPYQGCGSFA